MNNFLYIFFSFIMMSLLISYMLINIYALGVGSLGLTWLALSAIIGFVTIVLQLLSAKSIYINKSFLVLILFFIYFITRITIDTQDIEMLKAYTIATDGGIITYYIFGAMVGIFFNTIKDTIVLSKQSEKLFIVLFFLSLVIFSLFFVTLYFKLLTHVRTDIFHLVGDTHYQRIGQFTFMSFIVFSFFYELIFIKLIKRNFVYKILLFLISLNMFAILFLSLIFSQLIGSNNTLIDLIVLLISLIIMIVFLSKKNILILSRYKFKLKKLFLGKITRILYIKIFIGVIVFLILLVSLIIYYDIDIYKLRILGYGKEGMTSVNTRLELWNYFAIHLDYSLLMGNMKVDIYTTGAGTYMHSLIASILTHLGLIGITLFFIYLYFAIKEKLYSKHSVGYARYIDNSIIIYSLIVFIGIFLVASSGVFFIWVPIWFLMGMIFPPFILKNNQRGKIENSNFNSIKQL